MCECRRILLVEDDSALRDTLADVLAEEGFEVACAANGQDALERLHSGPSPDLILLDLVMPVMDGWSFREAQRGIPSLARIPTVVLSASSPVESPRVRALGVQAVLVKPVGLDRLIGALRRILPARPPALAAAT
jgi:CheY-like chemotaxis protein